MLIRCDFENPHKMQVSATETVSVRNNLLSFSGERDFSPDTHYLLIEKHYLNIKWVWGQFKGLKYFPGGNFRDRLQS